MIPITDYRLSVRFETRLYIVYQLTDNRILQRELEKTVASLGGADRPG